MPEDGQRGGQWLVTRPGRYARPVTGNRVRDTVFTQIGYDAAEVDDLLRRVAAELDAGRPAEPLIRNATFQTPKMRGYNVEAVDWFLGQLLSCPGPGELAGMGQDPWRDLGVAAQFTRSEVGDLAGCSARQSRQAVREHYDEECRKAWRDFGQQPGVHLRLEWPAAARRELRTMERRTIASMSYRWSDLFLSFLKELRFSMVAYSPVTVSTGGKSFTLRAARSPAPGITAAAYPAARWFRGHFVAGTGSSQRWKAVRLKELVDETGMPVLYTGGVNFDHVAKASILFPDQRWLRFWVRGTRRYDTVMTAVDEAGNSVVRYRNISSNRSIVEITVHPDWELTEELVLAIAISAPWLSPYFSVRGGGG